MQKPQELRPIKEWESRWNDNKIAWHLDHVNTGLTENIEFLSDGKQNCRILVPFCGKTLDLLWLAKQGHTVIGVEAVEKAVEDFFKENDILHEKKNIGGNDHCYTAFDGRIKIFKCDYFKFNSSLAGGKVNGIWDCNALGAVSPSHWSQYLETSLELLDHPHGRILLQAFLYNQEERSGPPFSIPKEELSLILGDSYELQLLSKKPDEKRLERFGLSWLLQTLISIKHIS